MLTSNVIDQAVSDHLLSTSDPKPLQGTMTRVWCHKDLMKESKESTIANSSSVGLYLLDYLNIKMTYDLFNQKITSVLYIQWGIGSAYELSFRKSLLSWLRKKQRSIS